MTLPKFRAGRHHQIFSLIVKVGIETVEAVRSHDVHHGGACTREDDVEDVGSLRFDQAYLNVIGLRDDVSAEIVTNIFIYIQSSPNG